MRDERVADRVEFKPCSVSSEHGADLLSREPVLRLTQSREHPLVICVDAQRLARHSDIKLTIEVYSDYALLVGREARAAEKLVGLWRFG